MLGQIRRTVTQRNSGLEPFCLRTRSQLPASGMSTGVQWAAGAGRRRLRRFQPEAKRQATQRCVCSGVFQRLVDGLRLDHESAPGGSTGADRSEPFECERVRDDVNRPPSVAERCCVACQLELRRAACGRKKIFGEFRARGRVPLRSGGVCTGWPTAIIGTSGEAGMTG